MPQQKPIDISSNKHAVLYSFRRCPYAMRARMAVLASEQAVELRDIELKNKPASMIKASPKATVPVLICSDGTVLEESRDIISWSLETSDPLGWYPQDPDLRDQINALIDENDGPFKSALDRYKYHIRFPEKSREDYRAEGEAFLGKLDEKLNTNTYLLGETATIADVALFPFIRQFANSDRNWFDSAPYPNLRRWLESWTSSQAFLHIMKKRPLWHPNRQGPFFPDLAEERSG